MARNLDPSSMDQNKRWDSKGADHLEAFDIAGTKVARTSNFLVTEE